MTDFSLYRSTLKLVSTNSISLSDGCGFDFLGESRSMTRLVGGEEGFCGVTRFETKRLIKFARASRDRFFFSTELCFALLCSSFSWRLLSRSSRTFLAWAAFNSAAFVFSTAFRAVSSCFSNCNFNFSSCASVVFFSILSIALAIRKQTSTRDCRDFNDFFALRIRSASETGSNAISD